MRNTEISPYTEEWARLYSVEETTLRELLQKIALINIYHIGSTSIPTIGYAKPIIDILVVVNNIRDIDLINTELIAIGYTPKGENGIKGRRYFFKGIEKRTHHLHIFQIGHENINTHLNFKEYLTFNPVEAKKYGDLKIKLQKQYPLDHYKYQEIKQEFVNELVHKANEWVLKSINNGQNDKH